jgi:hypothetical protein
MTGAEIERIIPELRAALEGTHRSAKVSLKGQKRHRCGHSSNNQGFVKVIHLNSIHSARAMEKMRVNSLVDPVKMIGRLQVSIGKIP